ncbi:MAG: peptidoglycan DD-metalloendopeptidase family protein [Magnetococcales bacterium]|nr:peptidoglycan DD-metalloendopeptidase family protein [Magnetococcales bacterium]
MRILFSGRFFWLFVLILGAWPNPVLAAKDHARDHARSLERNRARLQQVVDRLRAEQAARDQAKGQEKSLSDELEQLDRRVAEEEQRRREWVSHADQLKVQIPELTRQIGILKGEEERARHLLDRQLRMAYGIGEQGMLKMLFSPRDVGQWREGIQYLGYLIQARNKRFLEYRDTVLRLGSAVRGHKELLERLAAVTARQEEGRQQLLQHREERAALLRRVQKDAESRERQMSELAQSQERLETFVTRMETLLQEEKEKAARAREARIARKKAAKEAKEAKEAKAIQEELKTKTEQEKERQVTAKKTEPTPGHPEPSAKKDHPPQEARNEYDAGHEKESETQHPATRISRFGKIDERRGRLIQPVPGHGRKKPPGMFFQAQPATPVRAVYQGEVVYADWFRGYGLMVILGHGHRAYSLYGHNQRLLVTQGDWVNEGDKIAETGDTGSLEGVPGLYFEIRHQGKVTNPFQWLASGG